MSAGKYLKRRHSKNKNAKGEYIGRRPQPRREYNTNQGHSKDAARKAIEAYNETVS